MLYQGRVKDRSLKRFLEGHSDEIDPRRLESDVRHWLEGLGFNADAAPSPLWFTKRKQGFKLHVRDRCGRKVYGNSIHRHRKACAKKAVVGSRYPEKVAGLIYLDAGYRYAYDPSPPDPSSSQPQRPITTVAETIQAGMQKYTRIDVPILAIYAPPHDGGITDPAKRTVAGACDLAFQGAMAKAFEKELPSARVVWLPHADHYVFRSNEADVLREMNTFIASLPLESPAARQN
jgi:hypothetical protein